MQRKISRLIKSAHAGRYEVFKYSQGSGIWEYAGEVIGQSSLDAMKHYLLYTEHIGEGSYEIVEETLYKTEVWVDFYKMAYKVEAV